MKARTAARRPETALLRILDANLNRAKEAVRVAEDLARFVLNDGRLALRFKRVRHDMTRVLASFPVRYRDLLRARDSARDVGRKTVIRDRKGARWQDLLIANFKRAQEALRVLEECAKAVHTRTSARFQRLRFELYELEKRTLSKF